MASSSVSQESLDTEDFEITARKSRIRNMRARNVLPQYTEREREEDHRDDTNDGVDSDEISGPVWATHNTIPEHDSPSRCIPPSRSKDKRTRPNHLHKGKLPKDKRKLREKRRSTGVPGIGATLAHLASTESTGDSLDDDEEEGAIHETKRNTAYNEVIDADNPQTPAEDRRPKTFVVQRNKSPSDLEADLEDNQDYDSAVSQSESNLTLVQKLQSPPQSLPKSSVLNKVPSVLSQYQQRDHVSPRPYQSPSETKPSSAGDSPMSRFRPSSTFSSNIREKDDHKEPGKSVSSLLTRYQNKTENENSNSLYGPGYRRSNFSSIRPEGDGNTFSRTSRGDSSEDKLKLTALEKSLHKEKEENRKLKELLAEKDKKIEELEREVSLLNQDLEDFDRENHKLVVENKALIRAIAHRSTNV